MRHKEVYNIGSLSIAFWSGTFWDKKYDSIGIDLYWNNKRLFVYFIK